MNPACGIYYHIEHLNFTNSRSIVKFLLKKKATEISISRKFCRQYHAENIQLLVNSRTKTLVVKKVVERKFGYAQFLTNVSV